MANSYRLLIEKDRTISYKGHRDYDSFSFDGLVLILDMEINNSRSWVIERNKKSFLSAFSFQCLRIAGETEEEIIKLFK